MEIRGESFDALVQYGKAKSQGKAVSLKLVKKGGQPVLQAVNKEEMGFYDRVMSRHNMRGYSLEKIANFMESASFCKALEKRELPAAEHQFLQSAFMALDQEIRAYNASVSFKRAIVHANGSFFWDLNRRMQFAPVKIESIASARLALPETSEKKPPRDIQVKVELQRLRIERRELHGKKAELHPDEFQRRLQALQEKTYKYGEEQLLQEVDSGRVVVDQIGAIGSNFALPSKKHWYPAFSALFLDLSPEGRSRLVVLQNKAQLHQEKRLAKSVTTPAFTFEKFVLERIYKKAHLPPPTPLAISKMRQKIIDELLQDNNFLQLEPREVKEVIQWKMHQAGILAGDLPPERLPYYCFVMDHLFYEMGQAYQVMDEKMKGRLQEIEELNLPPLTKANLKNRLEGECYDKLEKVIQVYAKRYIAAMPTGTGWGAQVVGTHVKRVLDLVKQLSLRSIDDTVFEREVMPRLDFYKKWGEYLKLEMSQGSFDSGESLGAGVCYALAVRWAIDEMKREPHTSLEELNLSLRIGSIKAQDRFYQAMYQLEAKKEHFLKSMGVEASFRFLERTKVSGKSQIVSALKELSENPLFQKEHNGASLLSIYWKDKEGKMAAHALTIVLQTNPENPKESVFRFSDPNFGTYDFAGLANDEASMKQARERFLEAFSDFLTTMYSHNFEKITCDCFTT